MAIPGLSANDAILTIDVEEGGFLVLGMTGFEHLGQMFEYTVDLAGSLDLLGSPNEVDLHKLVGTRATLKMVTDEKGEDRFWDGFVVRAKRGEMRGRYPTFQLTLRPWLWFATQRKNSKVFQDLSVKAIITEVLADYKEATSWKLDSAGDYEPLDYCIQHKETDFDFISRLMEEVGIYYFFEHEKGKHTLVFADKTGMHKPLKVNSTITWRNAMQSSPTITRWHAQEEARAIKTVLTEYDYLDPATPIKGEKEFDEKIDEPVGEMEWYEHQALVVQNGVKPEKTDASSALEKRAEVRMEELTGLFSVCTGLTNVQDFTVGGTFKLDGSSEDDGEYLIVSAVYRAEFNDHASNPDLRPDRRREGFRCEFMCQSVDDAPTYRSPRITPKPVIAGLETAVVVGTQGNEIETDIHGRIKVQFPWDRLGKKNKDSSCWLRVAQPWAGKQFGMFGLPRIGHEVIVQFLNGDPDRPIVTGSVYNKDNMPPWKLPARAAVSGVKTQSSTGGGVDTANELRFDDTRGSEYIWFQAEKNFHRLVRNDAFDFVGHNESVKVVLTRNEVIGENWFLDVTKDVMHNLGKDLHVNVAGDIFYTGAATYQMKIDKDMSAKIGGDLGIDVGGKTQLKSMSDIVLQSTTGKLSLKAGDTGDMLAEAMTIKIKGAMTVAIEASMGVSLKCGGSFVSVGPAGVDISGPLVKINSGGSGASASAALKASPAAPTDAKKEELLTPASKTRYENTFKDPLPHDEGGSNGPVA
jgi:type VI secretion system secreted protein VgrG